MIREERWQRQKQELVQQGYDIPDDATPESIQRASVPGSEEWAWEESKRMNRQLQERNG